MSVTHWLFSYGTLRQPEVQIELFGGTLETVEDSLPGFRIERLRITDPEVIALSGSDEHPVLRRGADGDVVNGSALAVTGTDLEHADRYEVDDYVRIAVTLASGRDAFVYIHRDDQ